VAASLAEIRALYELRVRREPTYPGSLVEAGPHTVRLVQGGIGWLSWSDLGALGLPEIDAVIEAEIERFAELGCARKFEWKLYGSDRPAELRERLVAHGFEPKEPADAILVLDLADLPEDLRSTKGHDVRRVAADEGNLEEIRRIMQEVWPEEDSAEYIDFLRASFAADPRANSLWLAYVDGSPVAEGRVEFACGEFAGIWGGATLPAYRNRGVYTALVAARAAEALDRGCRFLTIDASPMSRALLEKRGFNLIDTALECDWKAGAGRIG
jgi:GNAT superfamily N-acetyltransferase